MFQWLIVVWRVLVLFEKMCKETPKGFNSLDNPRPVYVAGILTGWIIVNVVLWGAGAFSLILG